VLLLLLLLLLPLCLLLLVPGPCVLVPTAPGLPSQALPLWKQVQQQVLRLAHVPLPQVQLQEQRQEQQQVQQQVQLQGQQQEQQQVQQQVRQQVQQLVLQQVLLLLGVRPKPSPGLLLLLGLG
jgi:hypothetical protein